VSTLQEYGKQTQYRRASLVVLAALEDLDEAKKAEKMIFPPYMRDKSMGFFPRDHKARQIAILVSESFWYRWVSMGVIAISVIAVIWTPNSSKSGPDSKAPFLTLLFLPSHTWEAYSRFSTICLRALPARSVRWLVCKFHPVPLPILTCSE